MLLCSLFSKIHIAEVGMVMRRIMDGVMVAIPGLSSLGVWILIVV